MSTAAPTPAPHSVRHALKHTEAPLAWKLAITAAVALALGSATALIIGLVDGRVADAFVDVAGNKIGWCNQRNRAACNAFAKACIDLPEFTARQHIAELEQGPADHGIACKHILAAQMFIDASEAQR